MNKLTPQLDIDLMNAEAVSLAARVADLRSKAGLAKMQRILADTTMEEWIGYEFQSSSGLTPAFEIFARRYIAFIKRALGVGFTVKLGRGHFYVSGFITNKATGKLCWMSCNDVRFFSNKWHMDILIRTAEHDKDYTGGPNNSTTLPGIRAAVERLTQ